MKTVAFDICEVDGIHSTSLVCPVNLQTMMVTYVELLEPRGEWGIPRWTQLVDAVIRCFEEGSFKP